MCSSPQKKEGRIGGGKRDGTSLRGSPGGDVPRVAHVLDGVHHDKLAVAGTRRVDGSAGVDAGVVLVGRHEIVHERLVAADVPHREDEVAFDSLRSRRRRRQFPRRDPLGPVRVHVEGTPPCPESGARCTSGCRAHRSQGATPRPPCGWRVPAWPRTRGRRCGSGGFRAGGRVAVRLQRVEPVGLGQHAGSHAVAVVAGAGEEALVGRRHQGQPVVARIDPRGFLRSASRDGLQRYRLGGGPHLEPLRVDQAVTPHPHRVARVGQFRQHEPAFVVGDDDLHELRRQVSRLGDHPDAGFRALGALDDTADEAVGRGESGCGSGFGRRTGNGQQNAGGDNRTGSARRWSWNTLASRDPAAGAANRRDVSLGVGC